MGKNGPTLVPEETFTEADTVEVSAHAHATGAWTRRHALAVHPDVEAHHVVSPDGTGIHVYPRARARQAGTQWIRRSSWWLQVHAPFGTPGVLDTGIDAEGLPWAVLELPPGTSLRTWRDAHGPLPVGEVVTVATGVAALLERIHREGWSHGDLRLDTIYRTAAGSVNLFGWGKVGSAQAGGPNGHDPMAGAPGDICALGTTILEALAADARVLLRSGRVAKAVAHALPDPTIEMRVLRHVLSRAVHPDPHQRWPDMETLHGELVAWSASFGRGRWG